MVGWLGRFLENAYINIYIDKARLDDIKGQTIITNYFAIEIQAIIMTQR